MTTIGTATALGNGPFEGFVDECVTTLFELCGPGGVVHHVVVSNLPEDDGYEPQTCVFTTFADGSLDIDSYITNNGALIDLPGDLPAVDVIESMGYEVVNA